MTKPSKTAIVTDSNSGITQDRGRELGIYVLPMPFFIDGELFLEDITLTQEQFYEKLGADSDISTSQPSPGSVMELWEKVLKEYDEIVCIPMSSGLSSTCFTAMSIAAEYKGRVQVVDNQRISVTQEQSVYDAMKLRDQGMSAAQIKEILEREKLQASIYITVDTLKYLKKRREDHTGGSSDRHSAQLKARTPDPGREAGRLRQSKRLESREKDHAECH